MQSFTEQIEINLPRERVIELFDNPENLCKWQPGLVSFTHQSGEPGQPGATSLLVFQVGRRRLEMTETVVSRNLPEEFSGVYAWPGGRNVIENRFSELGPDRTLWEARCSFEFDGLFQRVMGLCVGPLIRRQNRMLFQSFKAFAEEGTDVREVGQK